MWGFRVKAPPRQHFPHTALLEDVETIHYHLGQSFDKTVLDAVKKVRNRRGKAPARAKAWRSSRDLLHPVRLIKRGAEIDAIRAGAASSSGVVVTPVAPQGGPPAKAPPPHSKKRNAAQKAVEEALKEDVKGKGSALDKQQAFVVPPVAAGLRKKPRLRTRGAPAVSAY